MSYGPRPLLRHFGHKGEAADLMTRAAALALLNQRLRPYLPEPLDQHCMLANVRAQTAILAADSPGWASRLRYLGPALLPRLVEFGLGVTRIEVIVMPTDRQPIAPQARQIPAPSAEAARSLEQLAAHSSDAGFADVLRRLAARAKTPMR
jgi:hypothetical protein